jgi:hypothetical protein
LRHPDPGQIAIGLVLLFVPVVFAILLQHRLNRRLEVES